MIADLNQANPPDLDWWDLRLYLAGQTALVRRLPEPIEKIIGDLSSAERVLVGMDIKPKATANEQ